MKQPYTLMMSLTLTRSKKRHSKYNVTPKHPSGQPKINRRMKCVNISRSKKRRSQQSEKCKERRMLMNLTRINRRKRCVNIPRSEKAPTNKSTSVEDARSHTNSITKHGGTLMSTCYESAVTNIRISGTKHSSGQLK